MKEEVKYAMKFKNFKFEHGTVHIRLSIKGFIADKKKLYNSVTFLVIKYYHEAFYFEQLTA